MLEVERFKAKPEAAAGGGRGRGSKTCSGDWCEGRGAKKLALALKNTA